MKYFSMSIYILIAAHCVFSNKTLYIEIFFPLVLRLLFELVNKTSL